MTSCNRSKLYCFTQYVGCSTGMGVIWSMMSNGSIGPDLLALVALGHGATLATEWYPVTAGP